MNISINLYENKNNNEKCSTVEFDLNNKKQTDSMLCLLRKDIYSCHVEIMTYRVVPIFDKHDPMKFVHFLELMSKMSKKQRKKIRLVFEYYNMVKNVSIRDCFRIFGYERLYDIIGFFVNESESVQF